MAAKSMALDVLVRLKDLLSSPLRGLKRNLEGVANMAKKIGLVGTAIAAISFMAPISQAAAFEQKLVDIAGTANLSGDAAFASVSKMKTQYEELALQIGQTSDTIADGAGQMIAAGLDQKLIDQSIGRIGKAATAAHAQFNDMAGVATSLMQTLKLPADQLDGALAGLIVSGKEGAFEMKDMARYLPSLTGQMAKFGVTGREAVNFLGAALQVAKKGTADPAEAANNLKNFLSKILAPTTIKNFKDAGVDIQAVMQDAATKGINPIEAVIQKIAKLTGTSGKEIDGLMKKAKASGLEGADALSYVREQLEKIHGAGKLGDLFSDMQVMDFLIPMLGNIDEYKRIKEEVAKATGAITDRDFDTQMRALNQQLVRFGEIGTQATREVGFAFGSWLPMINDGLEATLKWLRELDAQTGGMVRQALMFSGAAILVAAGLGALGVILPIIGAGLGAVAALFSPLGLILAAVAGGAVAIYKNWNTIGPRVGQIWQRLKTGFMQFADDMRDRGRRIVEAGREIFDRYGPIVSAGLSSAWASIKTGWAKLQDLFEGFRSKLDFKIDLSGLTIDDAKVRAFQMLDIALRGIAIGWQALKDFGSGFAPHLRAIGENLGSAVSNIVSIGEGFIRIGQGLAQIAGIDNTKVEGFFKGLGDFAGGSLQAVTEILRDFSGILSSVVNGIADLIDKINNGEIKWSNLMPTGVVDAWNKLASVIERVKAALNLGPSSAQPGETLPNGTPAGSSADGSDRDATMDDFLKGPARPAANSNRPAVAPAALPVQGSVVVKSEIKVAVDGPGRVVGQETAPAKNVPVSSQTGRAIGRV